MKKNILLSSLALVSVLAVTGCSFGGISEEEGKAWAEENGYVKQQESHIGKYEFDSIVVVENGEDKVYTVCSEITSNSDARGTCTGWTETRELELTETKYKVTYTYSSSNSSVDEDSYILSEDGDIYIDYYSDGAYRETEISYKDGKIIMDWEIFRMVLRKSN